MADVNSNEEIEASVKRFREMLNNLALSDFTIAPDLANKCIERIENGEDIESIINEFKKQFLKPN